MLCALGLIFTSSVLIGCSTSQPEPPAKEEIEAKKQWQERKASEQKQPK
jgi:hypothetical protein